MLAKSSSTPHRHEYRPEFLHPVFGGLTGTGPENARHVEVRVGFSNALADDARVKAVCRELGTKSGLYRKAEAIKRARARLDALATRLECYKSGMRGAPRLNPEVIEGLRPKDWRRMCRALDDVRSADHEFGKAWKTFTRRLGRSSGDLVKFVRDELGHRWPWLIGIILEAFRHDVFSRAGWAVRTRLEVGTRQPADVKEQLEGLAREPMERLKGRLREMQLAVKEATQQTEDNRRDDATGERGSKRGPGKRREHLRAWGRWYYEKSTRKPARTPYVIANEVHKSRLVTTSDHPLSFFACGCQKEVREGIREAERLLGLTAYRFK